MSWLTEIAGRAEDLLNRVDQTAATALQNKSKSTSSNSYETNPHVSDASYEPYHTPISTYPSSPHPSKISEKVYTPSALASNKKKPESDDEKLFRFLNCDETLPTPRRPKSSPIMRTTKDLNNSTLSDAPQADRLQSSLNDEEVIASTSTPETKSEISNAVQCVEENLQKSGHEIQHSSETPVVEPDSPKSNDASTATNEELLLAKKRAEHSEAEMKRMQRKLEHWNSQISGNDKFVRELQEREKDMVAAMDAKDSQLAVLKVRLQEADHDLQLKQNAIEDLRYENQRLLKDHGDESTLLNQRFESTREQAHRAEAEANQLRESLHLAQTEHMQRMSKMEEEHRHLVENYMALQKKWSEVYERNKELSLQLQNANGNFDTLQQEYDSYKHKAQRILQSKENLIARLKEGNFDVDEVEKNEAQSALLSAEVEGIKQERDLLREELCRANEMVESYRTEVQELEKMSQNDLNVSQERYRVLKEQLEMERVQKEELNLLCNQLKEELKFLREDFSGMKHNLHSRLQDREMEIEKLRRQLTAKSLSTVSQDELESRLHALTENLIQKQTLVEALSTEKNSLVLQLERLEKQLKEAQHFGSHHHTLVGVSNHDTDQKTKPVFLENPFDSTLTRRVKRVYGSIDAFSIRLGSFFRRYPITRVFVIIYMLLLHFWVMVVLLTYEPEIHYSGEMKQ